MLPTVEWSINAYTVGVVIFAIAGFYWVTKSDMKNMKEDVTSIKSVLERITIVVTDLAVQKKTIEYQGEQIAAQAQLIARLDDRLHNLSKGQGFIQRDLDGQYPR
jgi:uncharacterized coiled-coil protein SlyX